MGIGVRTLTALFFSAWLGPAPAFADCPTTLQGTTTTPPAANSQNCPFQVVEAFGVLNETVWDVLGDDRFERASRLIASVAAMNPQQERDCAARGYGYESQQRALEKARAWDQCHNVKKQFYYKDNARQIDWLTHWPDHPNRGNMSGGAYPAVGVVPGNSEDCLDEKGQKHHHRGPPESLDPKHDRICPGFVSRLETTCMYLVSGHLDVALLSGGYVDKDEADGHKAYKDYNEALRGRDWLIKNCGPKFPGGAPALEDHLLVDTRSEHTITNIHNTDRMLSQLGIRNDSWVITDMPVDYESNLPSEGLTTQGYFLLHQDNSHFSSMYGDKWPAKDACFSVQNGVPTREQYDACRHPAGEFYVPQTKSSNAAVQVPVAVRYKDPTGHYPGPLPLIIRHQRPPDDSNFCAPEYGFSE